MKAYLLNQHSFWIISTIFRIFLGANMKYFKLFGIVKLCPYKNSEFETIDVCSKSDNIWFSGEKSDQVIKHVDSSKVKHKGCIIFGT